MDRSLSNSRSRNGSDGSPPTEAWLFARPSWVGRFPKLSVPRRRPAQSVRGWSAWPSSQHSMPNDCEGCNTPRPKHNTGARFWNGRRESRPTPPERVSVVVAERSRGSRSMAAHGTICRTLARRDLGSQPASARAERTARWGTVDCKRCELRAGGGSRCGPLPKRRVSTVVGQPHDLLPSVRRHRRHGQKPGRQALGCPKSEAVSRARDGHGHRRRRILGGLRNASPGRVLVSRPGRASDGPNPVLGTRTTSAQRNSLARRCDQHLQYRRARRARHSASSPQAAPCRRSINRQPIS